MSGRVARRRRVVFLSGVGAMTLLALAAAAIGTGCIFDDGGYEGGGRRGGTPSPSGEPLPSPPTATGTGSSSAAPTSSAPDAGSPPDDGSIDPG